MQISESPDPTSCSPPVQKSARLIPFALVALAFVIGLIIAWQSNATWGIIGRGCQVKSLQDSDYQASGGPDEVDAQVSTCICLARQV